MGEHVLYTTISIFDVLAHNGNIDGNTCFGEDSIYTVEGLQYSLFIGKGVPVSRMAVTFTLFTPLPGVSMGPLKSMPRLSMVCWASGVIPLEKPLSNTHLPISNDCILQGLCCNGFKASSRTASMISGPIPSPLATAIFISELFNVSG